MPEFKHLPAAPIDAIMRANTEWLDFKASHDNPINTTIGVLIDNQTGAIWRPRALVQIRKQTLSEIEATKNYGYQSPAGNENFIRLAKKFATGQEAFEDILGYQSLGGTGALTLTSQAIMRLYDQSKSKPVQILIDTGWPNHQAIFGGEFDLVDYPHVSDDGSYNHQGLVDAIDQLDTHSVLLLQVCGYNDDGVGRSKPQWDEIISLAEEKELTLVLDAAYLGLGEGLESDCYPIQRALASGLLTFICVSFSKNMGLYNERLGALFVANSKLNLRNDQTKNLDDLIRKTIRRLYSNPPLLVAESAVQALATDEYYQELESIRSELMQRRKLLADTLGDSFQVVGRGDGLFTKLFAFGFTDKQLADIKQQGVFVLQSSRINIGGIKPTDIERVATVIKQAMSSK